MAGDLTRLCCSSCPWSILPQWAILPLTFAVSISLCEATGLIFTRACPGHSLCLILLPLPELPWKILHTHVDFKFHLLNCYKLKLWLAAFSPEVKWAGENTPWFWPPGEEMEVVGGICLLLYLGPHFCLTVLLTGQSTVPAVCFSMSWDMPIIILSNIQYKRWGSISCFQSARSQPAAPAVPLL